MSWLVVVLLVKIIVTVVFVALPALFAPPHILDRAFDAREGGQLIYRLYGVAIMALLVGYIYAIYALLNGVFPWGILFVGITSNGGAAYVLWQYRKNRVNLLSAIFFGGIASAFALSLVLPI